METETGSRVGPKSRGEDLRRRVLGALLSGTLGMAIGFGLFGGWDWVSIIGLPVRPRPVTTILPICLTAIPIGVPFLVWGLLVAWRRQWRELVRVLAVCCAIVVVVVWLLVVWVELYPPSLGIALATVAAVAVASLLFRGVLALLELAIRRWRRAGYVAVLAAILLAVLLGRVPTLPLSMMGARTDVEALRAVHQHAQAQGWEGYTLELGQVGSATATVRVHLPGGRERTCDVTVWVLMDEEPAVQCKP
jgi:hypothetical protein